MKELKEDTVNDEDVRLFYENTHNGTRQSEQLEFDGIKNVIDVKQVHTESMQRNFFHHAAKCADIEALQFALNHPTFANETEEQKSNIINMRDKFSDTPLDYLCLSKESKRWGQMREVEAIRLFVANGGRSKYTLDGNPLLTIAAYGDRMLNDYQNLFSHIRSDIDEYNDEEFRQTNKNGWNVFHAAAKSNYWNSNMFRLLINRAQQMGSTNMVRNRTRARKTNTVRLKLEAKQYFHVSRHGQTYWEMNALLRPYE